MLNSITNIVVIILLLLYLQKKRAVPSYIIAMIVYLSFHYAFAVLMSLVDGSSYANIQFHLTVPLHIKMLGMVFLLFCALMILYKVKNELISVIMGHKNIFYTFTILILAFLFSSTVHMFFLEKNAFNVGYRMLFLSHMFVSAAVWVLAIFIATSLLASQEKILRHEADIVKLVLILIMIQALLGFLELYFGVAFATTTDSFRASGTLFNPNILGLWLAGSSLLVSYLYYMRHIRLRVLVFSFIMISLIFIFCSSRTGVITSFVSMFIVLILPSTDKENNKMRFRYKLLPIGIMIASLLSVISLIKVISSFANNGSLRTDLLRSLIANTDRMINLVPEISIYLIKKLLNKIEGFVWYQDLLVESNYGTDQISAVGPRESAGGSEPSFLLESINVWVVKTKEIKDLILTPDVKQSIQGRISGVGGANTDNTYIYIQAVAGWSSLLVWLSILGFSIWLGARKYKRSQDITTVYTLSFMSVLLFSGITMRSTQLFPMWIFLAIFIGISLYWWLDLRTEKHDINLSKSTIKFEL